MPKVQPAFSVERVSQAKAVAFHGQLAGEWEQKYRKASFASRQEIVRECLEGINLKNTTWLDAGCGTGTLARWLAEHGCRVEAVDAAPEMVQVATTLAAGHSKSLAIKFQQVRTIEALPFPSNTFDGVLCSSVLEYVADPEICIAEFGRVLRPKGVLLISVPSARSLVRKILRLAHASTAAVGRPWPRYLSISRHQYSAADFRQFLQAHGFTTEHAVPFGTQMARLFPQVESLGSLLMFRARRQAAAD